MNAHPPRRPHGARHRGPGSPPAVCRPHRPATHPRQDSTGDRRRAAKANCAEIRLALGVYVTGAVSPAERAPVDEHLTVCRQCRDELAGLAGLPGLLSRVALHETEGAAGGTPPVAPWTTVTARDAATNVSAQVRFRPSAWGTQLDVSVSGVPYPTRCELWVRDPAGDRLPAESWQHRGERTRYPGSAGVPAKDISGFEITARGATLVTVPARPGRRA